MRQKQKHLLAGIALVLSTSLAGAADLPRAAYKASPVMAAYNWSGFYAGLHAGYGWGDASTDGVAASTDVDGVFGGGQVGFNWQQPGSALVLGVEADVSGSNIGDSATVGPVSIDAQNRVFGTARGRVGYAVDRVMFYGTGGFGWANNEITIQAPGVNASSSKTHTGWAAGGGIEWAVADRWSAKAEYMRLQLGSETYFSNVFGGIQADAAIDTAKLGLNYRFTP